MRGKVTTTTTRKYWVQFNSDAAYVVTEDGQPEVQNIYVNPSTKFWSRWQLVQLRDMLNEVLEDWEGSDHAPRTFSDRKPFDSNASS